MEKLKVGHSFEVVEALIYESDINQGNQYIMDSNLLVLDDSGMWWRPFYNNEYKPIGKLTITSIKKGGSHLSKINAKAIELYNTYRDKAPVLEANIKSKRRAMLHCDYKVEKAIKRADFIEAVFYQEVKQELLNLK